MPVGEMLQRLSSAELTIWIAEDKLRESERKAAERQASKGMRPR